MNEMDRFPVIGPSASVLRKALEDATDMMVQMRACSHPIVCVDAKCREANHEHESYGPEEWGCGDGCPCVPVCKGFEPEMCPAATKACNLIDEIQLLLHPAPASPP